MFAPATEEAVGKFFCPGFKCVMVLENGLGCSARHFD